MDMPLRSTFADLVFQHYGLATLVQAISAQVPTITNVAIHPTDTYPRMGVNEVMPFYRVGLCKLLYEHSCSDDILDSIEALLYNEQEILKMQEAQRNHCYRGEPRIYESMMKYLQDN